MYGGGVVLLLLVTFVKSSESASAFTAINGLVNGQHNIGLTTLVTSVDTNFIPQLGVFRALRDGVYFFIFSALSAENVGFRISLRKNGQPVVTGFADSQGFNTATLSCVVHMRRGELMYPYLEEGGLYESEKRDRSYTTFTGFELFSFDGNVLQGEGQFFETSAGGQTSFLASGDDNKNKTSPLFVNLPVADPNDNIQQLVQQELGKTSKGND